MLYFKVKYTLYSVLDDLTPVTEIDKAQNLEPGEALCAEPCQMRSESQPELLLILYPSERHYVRNQLNVNGSAISVATPR